MRDVEVWPIGQGHRGTHLGHQLGPEQLLLPFQRGLQLEQAALAQLSVGRPRRLVEGTPSGRDGPFHVLVTGIAHLTEHFFGRRVDVVEHLSRLGLDELAVDQHPQLALERLHLPGGHGGFR
jgi:hypothetical protein